MDRIGLDTRISRKESFLLANDGLYLGRLSLNTSTPDSISNNENIYGSYFSNKSSFAIKTVKFKPKEGATIIQASKKEDKYVFYSSYGETYEWVVDLKEMQAQRILNSYCAQLSRVGLNESEWLRLIAKQ